MKHMKNWIKFLGIIGLVIFLFGILGGFFIGFGHTIMISHLVVGLIMLGVWFAMHGSKNLGSAPDVIKGRRSRFGFNAALYGAVFLGILACINFLGNRDKYNVRWDLTEEGVFSLSDQSQKVVKSLKEPLELLVFNVMGGTGKTFDTVKLYSYYSDKVKVEIIDPNAKPHLVDKYGMKQGNIIYLAYGDKDGVKAESRINEMTEEAITNAIVKLTRGAAKKMYYAIGHGEPDLEAQDQRGLNLFVGAVGDEHMIIEPINLAQKGSVPDDAAALVLVSPKTPYFPEEKTAITDYADKGGKLLIMRDPGYPAVSTDLKEIAAHYGINLGDDLVLDTVMQLFAGPSIAVQFMASSIEQHPITDTLSKRDLPIMNLASSVQIGERKEGATYTELFKSSPKGWAENDIQAIFTEKEPVVSVDASDTKGPVSLAVAYEKEVVSPSSKKDSSSEPSYEEGSDKIFTRVVVVGDSDWMTNGLFQQAVHRDLALNTLNWLVGESSSIAIRPKKFKSNFARLPKETYYIVLGSGFFVPEMVLLFGLLVWWRRKTA